jgi:hypothetical protein
MKHEDISRATEGLLLRPHCSRPHHVLDECKKRKSATRRSSSYTAMLAIEKVIS